jgi:hypothetical protein
MVEIPALQGRADCPMHEAERFYLLQNLGSFHLVLDHLQQKSSQGISMSPRSNIIKGFLKRMMMTNNSNSD